MSLPELTPKLHDMGPKIGMRAKGHRQPRDSSPHIYTMVVRAVGRYAGLPQLCPMSFRHGWFVRWLTKTRGNVSLVSKMSGTSEAMVLHYAKRLRLNVSDSVVAGVTARSVPPLSEPRHAADFTEAEPATFSTED
jgi:hypothetical protein